MCRVYPTYGRIQMYCEIVFLRTKLLCDADSRITPRTRPFQCVLLFFRAVLNVFITTRAIFVLIRLPRNLFI